MSRRYPSEAAREADEFMRGERRQVSPAAADIIEEKWRCEARRLARDPDASYPELNTNEV